MKVSFRLSESATVTIRVKRGSQARQVRHQAARRRQAHRLGAQRKKLKKGRVQDRGAGARRERERLDPGLEVRPHQAGSVAPWRPPADAWTRRDFLRNGFMSAALLCTVATPASLSRPNPLVTSAALRAQARSPFEPFRRDLPLIPELAAGPAHADDRLLRRLDPRGVRRRPARLPDADLRLRGHLSRADDPRAQGPPGRRHPAQPAGVRLERPPARRLRPGGARRASDGRHRRPAARSDYEYPNDQDAATLWYHDHAHGRTSRTLYYGLLAFYVLEDDLERELDLPAGDYDVPIVLADHAFNRDGSFRYAGERRRRLPRRHADRQRRRLAAHARRAAHATASASSTPPTAARTRCGSAAAGGWCRSPATAGCSSDP